MDTFVYVAGACALLALGFAFFLFGKIMGKDQGDE